MKSKRTQKQINAQQRKYRLKNGNACTRKYEKTPRGFLMRAYRNMKSRTLGLVKPHIYKGLSLLSKELFYSWASHNPDFRHLYRRWVELGYDRRFTPSINRVDSTKGYDLGNIEWVTHSLNSSLGARNKYRTEEYACIERLVANA